MSTQEFHYGPDCLTAVRSRIRTTIETAFLRNNVVSVDDPEAAYRLALKSSGTIELTGMPVFEPKKQGLPEDARVLLFNDGAICGRCAAARRILGEPGVDEDECASILREAIYDSRTQKMYSTEAIIGLDEKFMVKAHLLVPEGHENIFYNWLINFQYVNDIFRERYSNSQKIEDGDIFIFSDPAWTHPNYPMGLVLFDPIHNCAAILGMRYFGEFKKATLTLAWGTAVRNGYVSCHGGLKKYDRKGNRYVMAVFGLSGSGKSTITHSRHDGRYDITVLHDDAFVISSKDKFSIALEPAYFDKTADYPMGCDDNRYILTLQNNGAERNNEGKIVAVTEDLRNGNGRAIKSRFWTPRRVDRIDEPIDAIFWLMKDPTLPPVVRLKGASLGAVMGATLATKRTSAERLLPSVDPSALVVEPYANPFRTYPLACDYNGFKNLMSDGVECYILNTGDFMGRKIPKEVSLSIIASIVEGSVNFERWGTFSDMEIINVEGYSVDMEDENYRKVLANRMNDRIHFVRSRSTGRGGIDSLPDDALEALQKVVDELNVVH